MQGDEKMHYSVPTSSPSFSRFDNSLSTQRKLQQSAREKNLLLAEVQSLKQQLRSANQLVGLSESDRQVTWNRLIEQNIKSGTLACVFALKTLLAKRLASSFFRWRLHARMSSLAAEISIHVNHMDGHGQSNSFAPPPLPPSSLREHQQQQQFRGPPQETDATATLRLINARRLRAAIATSPSHPHHYGLDYESPASSGKAAMAPKTKSPGSSNGAPRYLMATESSCRQTSMGYQVSGSGLVDADSELRLVEHSPRPHERGGGGGGSGSGGPRGAARRDAEFYGFSQYDDQQPFSPVREREKRRKSKSSALRGGSSGGGGGGGGGGDSSYMAPTASATKKVVTPSDLAGFGSPFKLSPASGGGARNRLADRPPASPASPPSARASRGEGEGAATDGNPNNTSNGSIGSTGKGGAARKRASPESAQLRLLTGVGENKRDQSFDNLLRKY